jgi:hypothetical protein
MFSSTQVSLVVTTVFGTGAERTVTISANANALTVTQTLTVTAAVRIYELHWDTKTVLTDSRPQLMPRVLQTEQLLRV